MFNNKSSHEDILKMYVESVSHIIDEIKWKHESLKNDPDKETARSFHTQKLLRNWFDNYGNLPI